MLRLLNVAIPAKVPVPVRLDLSPESVSPPGLLPRGVDASTTVAPAIGFPLASLAVTVIVDALDPLLATIDVGAAVRVAAVADTPAGVTVTVAVCVSGTLAIVADTVLASAVVELSVPVATPLASVRPGCTSVLFR